MTVSSQTNNETFDGNGVTTIWDLPFRFFDNSDIYVYLIDVADQSNILLSLGTDYTLSGAGLPEQFGTAPGKITTLVPVPNGKQLYVVRIMGAEQLVDIVNQGRFFPEVHEDVFDRLTMLIQQAISGLSDALQLDVSRQFWDFRNIRGGNLGAPINATDATTMLWVQQYISSLLATGQGPANNTANVLHATPGGVTRTAQNRFYDVLSVKDFGAKGDGVTDDTASIQDCYTKASSLALLSGGFATGVEVYWPAGNYKVTGGITATGPVGTSGSGRHQTVIFYSHPTADCLAITSTLDTDEPYVRDIGFKAVAATTGYAVNIGLAPSSSNNFPCATLKDLHIWSDFGASYWKKGIKVSNCWHYDISHVFIKGATAVADWMDSAIEIGAKCIDGRLENCYVYGANTAAFISSGDVEGFRMSRCSFVAVRKGVLFDHSTSFPPHYDIANNHIAASENCIFLRGTSQGTISENLLYLGDQASALSPNNAVALYANTSNGLKVSKNIISRRTTAAAPIVVGISLFNMAYFSIVDNYLDNFSTAIVSDSACQQGQILDNHGFGNSTFVNTNNVRTVAVRTTSTLGVISAPQRAFGLVRANFSGDLANVTGDGTNYTLVFNSEVDYESWYDISTGIYTCQREGLYRVNINLVLQGVLAGHTDCEVNCNIISGASFPAFFRPSANVQSFTWATLNYSMAIYLTAGQSITFTLKVSNGTKVVGLKGGGSLSSMIISLA